MSNPGAIQVVSPLLSGIGVLIDELEQRQHDLAEGSPNLPNIGTTRGTAEQSNSEAQIEQLDLFIRRLSQIRDWLMQDPHLLAAVDAAIGKQVQSLEHRQSRQNVSLAVTTTIAGAVLGWLISLLGTPSSVLHAFIR